MKRGSSHKYRSILSSLCHRVDQIRLTVLRLGQLSLSIQSKPSQVKDQLTYDAARRMWKANVSQAIRDMKATNRNCDLIDWEVANELI